MTENIKVPKENDDQINTTLQETLPDKINNVELGSKEQKGVVLSYSSLLSSYPLSLLSSSSLFLSSYPLSAYPAIISHHLSLSTSFCQFHPLRHPYRITLPTSRSNRPRPSERPLATG